MSNHALVSEPKQAALDKTAAAKPQRVLACLLCSQRKIKCDRVFPCANCARVGAQCVPAAALARRPRRRRFPERELLERLRHYETLLSQNNVDFEPLHPHEHDHDHAHGSDGDARGFEFLDYEPSGALRETPDVRCSKAVYDDAENTAFPARLLTPSQRFLPRYKQAGKRAALSPDDPAKSCLQHPLTVGDRR